MTKQEWDELDENARNEMVWAHFPEITPSSDDWVLSTNGGATGFDFFDTEEEAADSLAKYAEFPDYKNATVVHWRHCRDFVTDRNASALVLDELVERENYDLVHRFEINLFRESGACFGGWNDIDTLRVSPDLICYCAVDAMEEE